MVYFYLGKTLKMSHWNTVRETREIRSMMVWSNLQTLAAAFIPFSNWSDTTMCQAPKTVQIVKPSPRTSWQMTALLIWAGIGNPTYATRQHSEHFQRATQTTFLSAIAPESTLVSVCLPWEAALRGHMMLPVTREVLNQNPDYHDVAETFVKKHLLPN